MTTRRKALERPLHKIEAIRRQRDPELELVVEDEIARVLDA